MDPDASERGQVLHKSAAAKGRLSLPSREINNEQKQADKASVILAPHDKSTTTGPKTPPVTRKAEIPPPRPVRTRTKIARDAVFGASDEELSELSEPEVEDVHMKRRPPNVKEVRRRSHVMTPKKDTVPPPLGIRHESAIDSGDEVQPVSRSSKKTSAARAKRIVISDDEEPPKATPPPANPLPSSVSPIPVALDTAVAHNSKSETTTRPRPRACIPTSAASDTLVKTDLQAIQEDPKLVGKTKSSGKTKKDNKLTARTSPQPAVNKSKSAAAGDVSESRSKPQSKPQTGRAKDGIDTLDDSSAAPKTRSTRASAAAASKKLLATARAERTIEQ